MTAMTLEPKVTPMIPRVTSQEFVEKFFARKIPAIVTGATADWGMSGQWSPEYLTSLIGDKTVSVSISANGRFSYDTSGKGTSDGFSEERMSFAEAARQIAEGAGGRELYLMQQSIPKQFPELMKQIRVPRWVPNVEHTSINLWFGRNSVTPLHYDATNNFFAQQYGEKQFTIFSPMDSANVYPHPLDSKMAHLSAVNVEHPDLNAHPNFAVARPIRFTVKAGELLYLPAFWWHQVRSPHISTSVSIWWMPDLQQYIQAPNGPRKLYRQYETDRLASLKKNMLMPNRLGFATAASLALSAGRKWAACLLSLAACDESIGNLANKHNLPRTPGCSLQLLAGEMRETLRKLAFAGVPANTLPPSNAVEAIITLAGRVARGSDPEFSTEEVGTVIKLASTLEHKA
jgi:jumonji domain-containing protein 7